MYTIIKNKHEIKINFNIFINLCFVTFILNYVENTVEGLVEDTVSSRIEDRYDEASIHPLSTVAVPVPMNAQKNTDTESNTHKDKRVALTTFEKSNKFRSYK